MLRLASGLSTVSGAQCTVQLRLPPDFCIRATTKVKKPKPELFSPRQQEHEVTMLGILVLPDKGCRTLIAQTRGVETSVCHVQREEKKPYQAQKCALQLLYLILIPRRKSLCVIALPFLITRMPKSLVEETIHTTQSKQEAVQCPLGIGLSLSLALYGAALTYIMWIRLNEYTGFRFSPLLSLKRAFLMHCTPLIL